MLGRDAELGRCRRFVAALQSGPATLAIIGAAGIGKSALGVLTTEEAAQGSRVRVGAAVCAPAESGLAYSGLIDLLGEHVDDVVSDLTEPQRIALDVAMMRRRAEESPADGHAVARATLRAVQALAEPRPLLLFVDDLQWLDPATRRVLAFVVRRLNQGDRVGLLTTARDNSVDLAPIAGIGYVDQLQLGGLNPDDVDRLVSRSGRAVPRQAWRLIRDACEGNPLYVSEMVRHVGASAGSVTLPPRLHELVRERVASLGPLEQDVLAIVSQAARPTRLLVGELSADGGAHDIDAAIDATLDAGVLVEENGALRFSHPLFGVGVSASLSRSRLRALHEQLADRAEDREQRARHLALARSRPDAKAADAVASGARQARLRGAPELAAELADAAVRLTPPHDADALRARRIEAAYDHVTSGALPIAAEQFRAALATEPPGWHRTDLLWRAAMLDFLQGDVAGCIEQLRDALPQAADDEQRLHILRRLAGMHIWRGELVTAVRHAEDGLALAARTDVPREHLGLISHLVTAQFMQGRPIDSTLLAMSDDLLSRAALDGMHEDPNIQLAPIRLLIDGPGPTIERLVGVRDRAVEAGDEVGIAWSGARLCDLEIAMGRWERAADYAAESLAAADRIGTGPALVWAHAAHAVVCVLRGDLEEAAGAATELERHSFGQPVLTFPAQAHLVRAFAAISVGDGDTARAHSLAAHHELERIGVVEPGVTPLRWNQIDALLLAGDHKGADDEAVRLTEIAARTGYAFSLAIAARARGSLLLRDGELDAALEQFDQALRELDHCGWPFERARTLLVCGIALRRSKQKRLARERLQQAADMFDALGARLWHARAIEELGRVSGRPAATPGSLTPSEHRVAGLVADGLTNDEVADRLHLSAKTVAAHLTSVYAKLGVRSRTELARQVAATENR